MRKRATYKKGRFGTSSDTAAVQEHLFHENFAGVVHAQSDHSQRVADKDHVNACLIGYMCRGKVVGGYDSDGLILAVQRHECW
jgi:D-mannonate dehydratase